MSRPRFWLRVEKMHEGEVVLSPEESYHLAKVLRLKPQCEVELLNGLGGLAFARVLAPSQKATRVEIHSVSQSQECSQITVCFSLPKPSAHEFIIRRCTELGVQGFQPLFTMFSLKGRKTDPLRWKKIMREVCKQCGELWLPNYHAPTDLERWLNSRHSSKKLIFCYEKEGACSSVITAGGQGVDLVIGPEGGFSESEANRLARAGALILGLGKNRLRCETAALVATVVVKKQIGE